MCGGPDEGEDREDRGSVARRERSRPEVAHQEGGGREGVGSPAPQARGPGERASREGNNRAQRGATLPTERPSVGGTLSHSRSGRGGPEPSRHPPLSRSPRGYAIREAASAGSVPTGASPRPEGGGGSPARTPTPPRRRKRCAGAEGPRRREAPRPRAHPAAAPVAARGEEEGGSRREAGCPGGGAGRGARGAGRGARAHLRRGGGLRGGEARGSRSHDGEEAGEGGWKLPCAGSAEAPAPPPGAPGPGDAPPSLAGKIFPPGALRGGGKGNPLHGTRPIRRRDEVRPAIPGQSAPRVRPPRGSGEEEIAPTCRERL